MGVYDTYVFPECPWCGQKVEEQMKPGNMDYFVFGSDPIDDVKMRGFYTHWECGKSFTVEFEIMPKMVIKKVED